MNYKKTENSAKLKARKRSVYGPSGGAGGIRTHVPLRTNGFQDRLVMTTSIQLHVSSIQLYVTRNISSGGTFGGTSKLFGNGRAREVLILLAPHRLVQTRSTGFQDRLVMTTSIQLLKCLVSITNPFGFFNNLLLFSRILRLNHLCRRRYVSLYRRIRLSQPL